MLGRVFKTCSTPCSRKSILEVRVTFFHSTKSLSKKKGMERYLKRTTEIYDVSAEESIPTFQYASDKHEIKKRIYVWGNAEFGQLGQKGFLLPSKQKEILSIMHKPFRLSFGEYEEVRTLSCGYGFTVFSTRSPKNRVCGTGFNRDGQIGYHERRRGKPLEIIIQPTNIELPLDKNLYVKKVSCGRAHTLLLVSDGSLLTLGNNSYGQAGRTIVENEDYSRNRLINQIDLNTKIQDIEAGQDHSLLLTESGEVLSAGWGADGQTGLGHYNNTDKFTKVEGDIKGEQIVKVSCTGDCVLALNQQGEIFGWGNSEYGQFRTVTEEQQINAPHHIPLGVGKIKDIASGGTVCLVLNEDGEVFVWGYGILGKGPNLTSAFKPELIPSTLFGRNQFNPDARVTRLFAGLNHQAALNSVGDLYIWGKNRSSCLGLGDQGDQFFPMKVSVAGKVEEVSLGVDHSAVIARAWTDC